MFFVVVGDSRQAPTGWATGWHFNVRANTARTGFFFDRNSSHLFGFAAGNGDGPAKGIEWWCIGMPFWCLTLLATVITFIVWRRTRPRPMGGAFPVEVKNSGTPPKTLPPLAVIANNPVHETPPNTELAHPTASEPARYCRQCGYELRGLTAPRCPECGRAFRPDDPHTYRRRPFHPWIRHMKRIAIASLSVALTSTTVWGSFFWGWYNEHRALAEMKVALSSEYYTPIISPWLRRNLGPVGFVFDRVTIFQVGSCSDISPLAHLTHLKTVLLDETNVEDLSPLAQLTNIENLDLMHTNVKDLSPLAALKNLNRLELWGTRVANISPLAGLTKLEYLGLGATQIGLGSTHLVDPSPLTGLKSLRHLQLSQYAFTAEQIRELQRVLPDCDIYCN